MQAHAFSHIPRLEEVDHFLAERIRLMMKLRRGGITNTAVLSAIEAIPREIFMPEMFHDQAYEDTALPIACGQTISQPTVVATMTMALELNKRSRVLEIGTGSGYQAAILSKLARHVYTIERHKDLLARAKHCFKELGLDNLHTKLADGSKGWKEAAPFDRIILTAAADKLPEELVEQLSVGGIIVAPIGEAGSQQLIKYRKEEEGSLTEEPLLSVRFVPLISGTL